MDIGTTLGLQSFAAEFSLNRVLRIFLISAAFVAAGCKPVPGKYFYLSLEKNDGIEVVEYGTANLPTTIFHDPMPVAYRLERDDYTLRFDIVRNSTAPDLRIYPEQPEDGTLMAIGIETHRCGEIRPQWVSKPSSEFDFRWACAPGVAVEHQSILVEVKDDEQEILGRETLEFLLTQNGYYVDIDSM